MKLQENYFKKRIPDLGFSRKTVANLNKGYNVRYDNYIRLKGKKVESGSLFYFGWFPKYVRIYGGRHLGFTDIINNDRLLRIDNDFVLGINNYFNNRCNDLKKKLEKSGRKDWQLYFDEWHESGCYFFEGTNLLPIIEHDDDDDNRVGIYPEDNLDLFNLVNKVDLGQIFRSYGMNISDLHKELPVKLVNRLKSIAMRVFIISNFERLDWLNFGQYEHFDIEGTNKNVIKGTNFALYYEKLTFNVLGLFTENGHYVHIPLDGYERKALKKEIQLLLS